MTLEVVGSRVFVFAVGAERTHVAGRVVDETMPYHFVLPLEAFATL